MRVTNKMISDQVMGNLSKNIARFMKLQNQMSTGRRINKPSDDPIGTIKDLSYRTRISEIEQFQRNISEGRNWLAAVDVALGDVTSMISQGKELAVALANDTFDATARDGAASEAESLFQQILQSGNLSQSSRYLFSGHLTRTQAFTSSDKGVVYNGDQGEIRYEIESQTFVNINIPGSDLLTKAFRTLGEDADLKVGINGDTLIADLNNGRGLNLAHSFVVTDNNLNTSVTVTIPGGTTDVNAVITEVNNQLTAGGIDNVTIGLGDEGNNLKLTATDKPDITLDTPLSNINQGMGLGIGEKKILVHNIDHSIEVTVDLSSATTVGDVINEINNTLTGAGINNVTASLNPGGTAIDIEDTNGVPLGLSVAEINTASNIANLLGIQGDIAPLLTGTDLNPQPDFSITESAPGETLAEDLGILGNMNRNLVGEDLDPNITLTTELSLMNNGLGYQLGDILVAQGDDTRTLDLAGAGVNTIGDLIDVFNSSGLDIQASINEDRKGIQVESTVIGKSLLIQDTEEFDPAFKLGIAGSPDVMGNFIYLIDALRSNDQQAISDVIGGFESAIDHILNERSSVGAKMVRFETTESRLLDYNVEVTKLLSETEGADIIKLVADLAMQENVYTAALNSASKIIQPSLLDFIR